MVFFTTAYTGVPARFALFPLMARNLHDKGRWGYKRWATNLELEVTRLGTLEARRHYKIRKLGLTREEHKDKDKDQGDKIGRNDKARLMCQ